MPVGIRIHQLRKTERPPLIGTSNKQQSKKGELLTQFEIELQALFTLENDRKNLKNTILHSLRADFLCHRRILMFF